MTTINRSNPKFTFVSKRENPLKFDLDSALSKYLYSKKIEKRSVKTLEAYEQTLGQFRKWIEANDHKSITAEVIRQYVHYLSFEKTRWDDHQFKPNGKVGLSGRTVNNNIRNLKLFFKYLVRERVISYSPMDAINYQTQEKDTFEVFTDEDVVKLLDSPNKRIYTGLRDYCMMLVLIDTACRCGEMTQLKISDLDFKLRTITFRAENTKSNQTRVIPISQRTAKELEKLIAYMNVEPDDYLWLTQFGERYFADSFGKMLKKYAEKASVTGARVSPHTFRHYAAVTMLKGGMNPIELARILGHSSVSVTEIYVRYTQADLSAKHEVASPVTRLIDKGNERKRGKMRFK